MIPNMNEFYKSNFGITFDTVKTNNSADMGIYRKLTSFEKQKIQQGIEDVYETFISRVSEGRDISTNKWIILVKEEFGLDMMQRKLD